MKRVQRYFCEFMIFFGIYLLLFLNYAAQREPTNFIYYNF